MNGAQLLVRNLKRAGVSQIFALSGNQIMPIFDACLDEGIEITHVRQEAAAVYMAEAYAQITGGLGVALVTAGAGIANALAPLFTSTHSQTPVLLLSGDSPLGQDGLGSFQEMDQVSMTQSLTKYSSRPSNFNELYSATELAIATALEGAPGPVHLALADDLLRDEFDEVELESSTESEVLPGEIDPSQLDEIEILIVASENPLVVLGPSLNETRMPGIARMFTDDLHIPAISMESPRGLNDPALGDLRSVFAQADLILSIDKSIDFTTGFGSESTTNPNAKWIVVNSSDQEFEQSKRNLGKRLCLSISAAPKTAIDQIITSIGKSNAKDTVQRRRWCEFVQQAIEKRSYESNALSSNETINSMQLCLAVQKQVEKHSDNILISDGGEFGQWAQAVTKGNKRIVNGVAGSIGGSTCYAIAANKASPSSTVFALMGDGTAGFHFMEFETAVRERTPFVAIIGNDLRWNAEHQIQLLDYGEKRLSNCQLSDARYDLAAEAFGAHGEYVTKLSEIDAALERSIASGKPACINVIIEGLPAPKGPSS